MLVLLVMKVSRTEAYLCVSWQVNAVNCNTCWKIMLFMSHDENKEDVLKGVCTVRSLYCRQKRLILSFIIDNQLNNRIILPRTIRPSTSKVTLLFLMLKIQIRLPSVLRHMPLNWKLLFLFFRKTLIIVHINATVTVYRESVD